MALIHNSDSDGLSASDVIMLIKIKVSIKVYLKKSKWCHGDTMTSSRIQSFTGTFTTYN